MKAHGRQSAAETPDPTDHADDHLAELEALHRTADAGLALLDRELRFLRLNERLAAMDGVPLEAHFGRTIREVVPHVAADAERAFAAVFETGDPIYSWQLEARRRAGRESCAAGRKT